MYRTPFTIVRSQQFPLQTDFNVGSSLGQLLSGGTNLFRIANRKATFFFFLLPHSIKFCKVAAFPTKLLFQKRGTFYEQLLFGRMTLQKQLIFEENKILQHLLFQESYIFEGLLFQKSCFSSGILSHNILFQKRYFFSARLLSTSTLPIYPSQQLSAFATSYVQ